MTAAQPNAEAAIETLLPMWEDADVVAAFVRWHPGAAAFYRPVSAALLAEAGVRRGTRLLDVGTGTGIPALLAAEVADPGGEVVATDPSAGLLTAAEANARAAGAGNLSFRRAAAEALPFPDASFDLVTLDNVLEHVQDREKTLAEIRRVLKPGGCLLFLEHVRAQNPKTAKWQDRLHGPWHFVGNGCNCNRDTAAARRRAGFELDLETWRMPKAPAIVRPVIEGVATPAPAAS